MKLCALRMLCGIKILVLMALSVLAIAGCQDTHHSEQNPSGPVTVKIPVLENGTYKLRTVVLTSLSDMKLLRGEAAHFLFSPSYRDGELVGIEPRVHLMRTSDGVYVAEDSMSLQLLTLYANFEGLMKLDESLGIKSLNTWPRPVAVNTKVADSDGKISRDNARYSGQLDAFLFEPFTLSDLPLAVNAGVIGHEHFHSIFYKLVLQKIGGMFTRSSMADPHQSRAMAKEMGLTGTDIDSDLEDSLDAQDLYHMVLLRGMNEGFADLWGWIYSGDTDFVARSIVEEKERGLDQESQKIPSSEDFENDLALRSDTLRQSYDLGSKYAKIFRHVVQVSQGGGKDPAAPVASEAELRQELAAALLRVLPRLADEFAALGEDKKLAPSRVVEMLAEEIPFLNESACDFLKSKLARESSAKICMKTGGAP